MWLHNSHQYDSYIDLHFERENDLEWSHLAQMSSNMQKYSQCTISDNFVKIWGVMSKLNSLFVPVALELLDTYTFYAILNASLGHYFFFIPFQSEHHHTCSLWICIISVSRTVGFTIIICTSKFHIDLSLNLNREKIFLFLVGSSRSAFDLDPNCLRA